VVQNALGQTDLYLEASGVENVVVTGVGGVYFGSDFNDLVSFDASALDADSDTYASASGSTNDIDYVGGAGEDYFESGSGDDTIDGGAGDDDLYGNQGADTINGGDGADFISGGQGSDTLTGGAGVDTFYFGSVSHSQGVTTDTITDFTSGEDLIDLSNVEWGTGFYSGEANGYGAVLTSLTASGDSQAVLDTSTSTLYVDVNGDGLLNDQDIAINLTGVTSLNGATDFAW
jgi:Ca2+-binding RTX toxin-like protein